uniref:Fibroblast growth factor receptor-like 1 n=1 Tax=Steinernema glaseri TaxID=37863 RepID=A0A1I7ZKG5_9BILA
MPLSDRTFLPSVLMLLLSIHAILALGTLVTTAPLADAGQGAPPEFFDDVQTRFRVPLGTKLFRLSCPVKTKSGEIVMIQWKKDGEQIGTEWNNRYKLSRSDKELKIRNPMASDSGRYQCMAINGFGHRETDFSVLVYDPSSEKKYSRHDLILMTDKVSPPKWQNAADMKTSMLSSVRISIGGKMELKCPAQGNPLPEIQWLKDQTFIHMKPSRTAQNSAKFELDNVDSRDSGVYTCRLKNSEGVLEASFRVHVGDFFDADDKSFISSADLDNDSPAPVIDHPFNSSLKQGQTAHFHCKVKWTQQQPLIRWLKKIDSVERLRQTDINATIIHANNMDFLLPDRPQTLTVEETKSLKMYSNRLILPDVQTSDSGTYICVVTSTTGHFLYRSAHLEVASDERHEESIPPVRYLFIGVPVVLLAMGLAIGLIYFLCLNQQPVKTANNITHDIRPPPPRHPPPQTPLSPSTEPTAANSMLSIKKNNLHPYNYSTGSMDPRRYRPSPRQMHRQMEQNSIYEASSPQQNYWAQTLPGLRAGQHIDSDYDMDYPEGRIQPYPSIYSCRNDDYNENQPFIKHSLR